MHHLIFCSFNSTVGFSFLHFSFFFFKQYELRFKKKKVGMFSKRELKFYIDDL